MGVWVGRRKKDNLAVGASGVSQAGNVQGQWFLFFFFSFSSSVSLGLFNYLTVGSKTMRILVKMS